ncbi:adenylyl-sulfate kinase [Aquimarina sp. 2201CG5-10]|uniref:adenylyl-sulfate kinase n=1 Tax=Aquimarina callyspongiae TaxID=3098150 RepID=UPI002AB3F329|nr:adenylyl-sulfate kinase [Aquimarina sp. 2201CG5-10]MDY8138865.1 adenylyl-sulfate kinase [Aquimarina sp. 2201CG5-10]
MSDNLKKNNFLIKSSDRINQKGHKPFVVWFTGLSGAGKTTISSALEVRLFNMGFHTYILDGDNVRTGINKDLNFTPKDRTENIRRIAEISSLFLDAGISVLAAFISPYRKDREQAKQLIGEDNFFEVFVNTPINICKSRDIKGLYKMASNGKIKNFTGITAPYESPVSPDVIINTAEISLEKAVDEILECILNRIEKPKNNR